MDKYEKYKKKRLIFIHFSFFSVFTHQKARIRCFAEIKSKNIQIESNNNNNK